jgi:hypothetical protein
MAFSDGRGHGLMTSTTRIVVGSTSTTLPDFNSFA